MQDAGLSITRDPNEPRKTGVRDAGMAWLLLVCTAACAPIEAGRGELERPAPSSQTNNATNSELSAAIGETFAVRMWRSADLDGDGDLDVVAVLSERDAYTPETPRTLLVLRRSANGRLERALENRNAVLPESQGGTLGDPLRDLNVMKNGFVLAFEGGSRELWSRHYTFEFVPSRATWFLTEFGSSVLDRHEGGTEQKRFDTRDFGEISAADFDPESLPVEGF